MQFLSAKTLTVFVIGALTLLSNIALAQEGALTVDIVDAETQRIISGVTVNITSRKGDTFNTQSDNEGIASFADIKTGLYELSAEHPDYLPIRQPSIRIVKNKTTPLSIQMQIKRSGAMEEVVVTGTAVQGNLLSSVGTSYKDRESLRSAAGSGSDVMRALDSMPGLFSDGEFSSYSVRGASPRDNLVLVDGFPFEHVVHYSQSFGEREEVESGGRYSVFAPNLVAGAEFQPGGWSSAYGGRAGSLLKLDVAEGNIDSPSYTARLDIAGVEVGYDGPSGFHKDTSMLLSVRTYDFGRFFETIGIDDLGTPTLTDVIVKTSTELSDRNTFEFLTIYAPEKFSRDIDNVLASDEENPNNWDDVSLVEVETDNTLIGATWKRLTANNGEINHKIYYRYFDEFVTSGEAYPDLATPGTSPNDVPARPGLLTTQQEETELGYRLDYTMDNRLGRLSTGLRVTQLDISTQLSLREDWIRFEYNANDFRPDPDQKYITLTPSSINNNYEDKQINYALYADQEWELSRWMFRFGVRYDKDGFSDENLVSPRIGATWFGKNSVRVTATAGRYYQSPTTADRASDPSNASLENEIIDQASVGLSWWVNDEYQLFIETYYQKLDNLVNAGDTVNQTFANQAEGHAYGIDTAITRNFDNGWSADAKYSYSVAKVKDSSTDPERDADYSRPHTFSLGGIWELNERWKFSGRWKWASGKPSDEYIIHEDVLGDGEPLRYSREVVAQNTGRFGHYSSINFRADYIRTFGRTTLIAFVDVLNLLGSDNPSNPNFNERTGINLPEDGETLPIIGLRFEW